MTDSKDQLIRDAQYRKGMSIAFFNSTNTAIEATKLMVGTLSPEALKALNRDRVQETVVSFRNFFIAEHDKYYAEVIANIGVNYSVVEAIKKIEATKSNEELYQVWLSFSEDERRDITILTAKNEIKAKWETAQ